LFLNLLLMTGIRTLKKEILRLLSTGDFRENLKAFSGLPCRQAVNPLFSFFFHRDDTVRWHAVSAMGVVVSTLVDIDKESARNVMRRLIWNLNDESGGIGWGSPEAMGEITARRREMAEEYSKLLRSYVMPHRNFLEHEVLQRGVLWGLARLAEVRPEHVTEAGPYLLPFLNSKDPIHRGLSVLSSGAIKNTEAIPHLNDMTDDNTIILIYNDLAFKTVSVGSLATQALLNIG
jgi:hypothetical protein